MTTRTLLLRAWMLAVLMAFLGGCILLTSFDPEGQPCDTNAPADQQCLTDAGYTCVDSKCTLQKP